LLIRSAERIVAFGDLFRPGLGGLEIAWASVIL